MDSDPGVPCPEPTPRHRGPVPRGCRRAWRALVAGLPLQARVAYSHLPPPPSIRKTCACTPHLDMILFSFSIKTNTTTTKARKRAYLLLILRLCRKSRQSWGKASPFSMGKGGAVGTQLRGITQDLARCLQVGDTLILWRDGLSGHPCLQVRTKGSFSTRLLRILVLLSSQTPEALFSWTLPQRDLKSGHLKC